MPDQVTIATVRCSRISMGDNKLGAFMIDQRQGFGVHSAIEPMGNNLKLSLRLNDRAIICRG